MASWHQGPQPAELPIRRRGNGSTHEGLVLDLGETDGDGEFERYD
jgi:hypothetical protein